MTLAWPRRYVSPICSRSVIGSHGSGSPYRLDLPEDIPDVGNYEELLNLAERLGEANPKGLSKLEIEHLLLYK